MSAGDAAGNYAEIEISSDEMKRLASDVYVEFQEGKLNNKWFIDDIFSRVLTRSRRGQVNFVILSVMLILLIAQQIILVKTGLTKTGSNSMLHIGLFAILLFAGMLGGGGEIL